MVALAKMNAPGGSYQLHAGHFTTPCEGVMQDQSTVIYRDIPGWPGYRVGNDGSVISNRLNTRPRDHKKPERWYKLNQAVSRGYHRVAFKQGEKNCWQFVHRLVLEAFVGPRPDGMQARHLDGNRSNNTPANLRWGTGKQNGEDRVRHGNQVRGSRVTISRLTEQQVIEIRHALANGATKKGLARKYRVSDTAIRCIARGRTWKHLEQPALFA